MIDPLSPLEIDSRPPLLFLGNNTFWHYFWTSVTLRLCPHIFDLCLILKIVPSSHKMTCVDTIYTKHLVLFSLSIWLIISSHRSSVPLYPSLSFLCLYVRWSLSRCISTAMLNIVLLTSLFLLCKPILLGKCMVSSQGLFTHTDPVHHILLKVSILSKIDMLSSQIYFCFIYWGTLK